MDAENKPLAAHGLVSYRYNGRYGWTMIGAKDVESALSEASRSMSHPDDYPEVGLLQVWDDCKRLYVDVKL